MVRERDRGRYTEGERRQGRKSGKRRRRDDEEKEEDNIYIP